MLAQLEPLCISDHQANKAREQDDREGQEMQASEGAGQPLVIANQTPKTGRPGEAALHDPALWQQHESALGGGQLDDLQPDAMGVRRLGWLRAGVALVDKGDLDHRAGRLPHLLGQLRNLRAILLVDWGANKASRWPSISTAICTLLPLRRLAPS